VNLRPTLRRALVLTALSTVWPLSACGGGNSQAWVGTFCGAGADLRVVLSQAQANLKTRLAAGESPSAIKLAVNADAEGIVAAVAKAEGRVREAGDPPVDEGKGIELAALTTYDEISTGAKVLQTGAMYMSDRDAVALTADLKPYSEAVADLGQRAANSLNDLKDYKGYADIEKASKKADPETHVDETCAKLQAVA